MSDETWCPCDACQREKREQDERNRRRYNDPNTCHWCGGRHSAVDCPGWDGR